jgi:hypothetical protein
MSDSRVSSRHHRISRKPREAHMALFGPSRTGKTVLMQMLAEQDIIAGHGITVIDPHGSLTDALTAFLSASPIARFRKIRIFKPAHADFSFGYNILGADTATPEGWAAAASAFVSVMDRLSGTDSQSRPQVLETTFLTALPISRHNLTLVETPIISATQAQAELRELLTAAYPVPYVQTRWDDLNMLARVKPRDFAEMFGALNRRLTPIVAQPKIARIVGTRENNFRPDAAMDGQEVVFFNLAGLEEKEQDLIGALLVRGYFGSAKKRAIGSVRHYMYIDEAERFFTEDAARGLDQTAKFGLSYVASFQRIGQIKAKGDFIADAVITNTAVKAVFRQPDPDAAEYFCRLLFTGRLSLITPKPFFTPAVIGHEIIKLKDSGASRARAIGESVGETEGAGETVAIGATQSMLHQLDNGYAIVPTDPLSMTVGTSENRGSSNFSAASRSASRVDIEGAMSSEHEALRPIIAAVSATTYSKDDMMWRMQGELQSLPRRCCFLKIEEAPPVLIATREIRPIYFTKRAAEVFVPEYERRVMLACPYTLPAAEADRRISERFAELTKPKPPPEPALKAPREPLPAVKELKDLLAEISPPETDPEPPPPPRPPPKKRPPKGGKPRLVISNAIPVPPKRGGPKPL